MDRVEFIGTVIIFGFVVCVNYVLFLLVLFFLFVRRRISFYRIDEWENLKCNLCIVRSIFDKYRVIISI